MLDAKKHLQDNFLLILVDKVCDLRPRESVVTLKGVSINEHFFQGHYPDFPVMPGVLIIDAIVQSLSLCFMDSVTEKCPAFSEVDIASARFKRQVVPGDQLIMKVNVVNIEGNVVSARAQALVDSQIAVVTEFSANISSQSDSSAAAGQEDSAARIHPAAVVSPAASVADDVRVGPFTFIDDYVSIDAGTVIGSHCSIRNKTTIGRRNFICHYSSLGEIPQIADYHGDVGQLIIGDDNVIREFCTLNVGSARGGGKTVLGNHNFLMSHVHIAHDCMVGDYITMVGYSAIAGHVEVEDYATLGGGVLVHQFCRVGQHAYVGGGARVIRDILPYSLNAESPAECKGLNKKGLRRAKFPNETLSVLNRFIADLRKSEGEIRKVLAKYEEEDHIPEVVAMLKFVRSSRRGVALY